MMVADVPSGFSRFFSMLSPKKAAQKSDSPTHSNNIISSVPRHDSNYKSGELERVFHYLDENGDGKISPCELRNGIRAAGEEMSAEEAACGGAVRFGRRRAAEYGRLPEAGGGGGRRGGEGPEPAGRIRGIRDGRPGMHHAKEPLPHAQPAGAEQLDGPGLCQDDPALRSQRRWRPQLPRVPDHDALLIVEPAPCARARAQLDSAYSSYLRQFFPSPIC